jgi:hypothetical protein
MPTVVPPLKSLRSLTPNSTLGQCSFLDHHQVASQQTYDHELKILSFSLRHRLPFPAMRFVRRKWSDLAKGRRLAPAPGCALS